MPLITKPHDYQANVIEEVWDNWFNKDVQNVCLVAPTGAGKTVIKAFTAKRLLQAFPTNNVIVFAHRDVLLTQISLALSQVGLPHRMLCSGATEKAIGDIHIEELGQSFLSESSRLILASVPTWIKRDTTTLCANTIAWLMDECHHTLRSNMWGSAVELWQPLTDDEETIREYFPNVKGLGVTATPKRADKRGLGRSSDGIYDTIVKTPGMGQLIAMGRLSNYKVYAPKDRIDMTNVNMTSSGDWNQKKLAKATDKVDITGDAVKHYKMYADGKQGIIFAASIAHSDHVAQQFQANGVNAVALSSKTNIHVRQQRIKEFRQGKIDLLVNYDLFGEGFDVPAVVVVIMLRKTASYSLFKQMFGRCLRVLDGKPYGILIDHVGNVDTHCSNMRHVHDDPVWTLDRYTDREKGVDNGVMTRICPKCRFFYLPKSKHPNAYKCPDCGHHENDTEVNVAAKELQIKDGILVEYDTGWLNEIANKINEVDQDPEVLRRRMRNAPHVVVNSAVKNHKARLKAQKELRQWIVNWCNETGWQRGLDVQTTQGEFERVFGVNIFAAQILSATEARELTNQIKNKTLDNFLIG